MRNILLTTHYLDLSGSSTFLQTLALYLTSMGFHVTVFGIVIDPEVKKYLHRKQINVVINLEEIRTLKMFCIISQHNISTMFARYFFPHTPLIYVMHGVLSATESPPSIDVGISRYIAVSEEVKEKLVKIHSISPKKIDIIRNIVDTTRFKEQKPLRRHARRVLFISSRYTEKVLANITEACKKLRLTLSVLGKDSKNSTVENDINEADIVISLGRGAIESLSCGRLVIIYDYQGGDGMISETNYQNLMTKNFSGRLTRKQYTVYDLIAELKKYDPILGPKMRKIAMDYFDINKEGAKVLSILTKAQPPHKYIKYKLPYKEMQWLVDRVAYFADMKRA